MPCCCAALPRIVAFRKAGNTAKNDHVADANSFRIERKPGVRDRIEYLTRQAQERIAEKRAALEEQLWAVLEADIGAFWETYEAAKTGKDGELGTDQQGKMLTVRKQRAKLINDLPPATGATAAGQSLTRHYLRHRGIRPRVVCLISNHRSDGYDGGNKGRK
jgi:hypothetical protein